jgi:hypothetical protein
MTNTSLRLQSLCSPCRRGIIKLLKRLFRSCTFQATPNSDKRFYMGMTKKRSHSDTTVTKRKLKLCMTNTSLTQQLLCSPCRRGIIKLLKRFFRSFAFQATPNSVKSLHGDGQKEIPQRHYGHKEKIKTIHNQYFAYAAIVVLSVSSWDNKIIKPLFRSCAFLGFSEVR